MLIHCLCTWPRRLILARAASRSQRYDEGNLHTWLSLPSASSLSPDPKSTNTPSDGIFSDLRRRRVARLSRGDARRLSGVHVGPTMCRHDASGTPRVQPLPAAVSF